jgi:hypothetical protein
MADLLQQLKAALGSSGLSERQTVAWCSRQPGVVPHGRPVGTLEGCAG